MPTELLPAVPPIPLSMAACHGHLPKRGVIVEEAETDGGKQNRS